MMYSWGSCTHGQLGLGGIEEQQILSPRLVGFVKSSQIVGGFCGVNHTLIVLEDGSVYSCGLNDYGQLGHFKGCMRLEKIDALSNQIIKYAACGLSHSLALNEWGQIFCWGQHSHGQLGIGKYDKSHVNVPKMIKSLAVRQAIQIACGYQHSMALMSNGDIYCWGNNSFGQLGLGTSSEYEDHPCIVQSLIGVPISQIAAGGYHSFVLTKSGAVYGWGKNSMWQLGFEESSHKTFPTHLKFLRSQKIVHICCGEEHTVALTLEGGLFTWGAGTYGQLGHNHFHNEFLPRKVIELMGSPISQVSCGGRHTLAYVSNTNKIYSFGLGGSGQLGTFSRNNISSPTVVSIPEKQSNVVDKGHLPNPLLFSGGAQSFVILNRSPVIPSIDMTLPALETQLQCLNRNTFSQFSVYFETDSIPLDALSEIETIFSSSSCLNCSFLHKDKHFGCESKNHGIDLSAAKEEFSNLCINIRNPRIIELINDCLGSVLKKLLPSPPDIECLRIYILLPCYPIFMMPEKYLETIIMPYAYAFNRLNSEPSRIICSWLSMLESMNFQNFVQIFKKAVAYILNLPVQGKDIEQRKQWIFLCLKVLKVAHQVNLENGNIILLNQFYVPEITEKVNVKFDYTCWVQRQKNCPETTFFCDYSFIFDAPAKVLLLQADAELQMKNAMAEAHIRNAQTFLLPLIDPVSPFLVFHVDRDNLVLNTLQQIHHLREDQLKRPLKVIFHGEEAIDQGGVKKEFFLLLMKELLDPKFGMFTRFKETMNIWFCETTYEEDEMFHLVGMVCGLAIYNFTIIDLPFPLALYKKLLNKETRLEDLAGLSPSLVRSLNSLLAYEDPDFEELFCLNFEITRENFGEKSTIELKANGKNISVTQKNKHEYVNLYVDYILNESVNKPYHAFHHGFHQVCGSGVLELFQPEELMEMVIGNEDYDWKELEANANYKEFYSANHRIIKNFWKVFHSLSQEDKKKFLLFLTGSDRIPLLGMKEVAIAIQPINTSDDHLPVAHTCFNLLDLPLYKSEEQLRSKLLQAIEHTQGFGLA